MFEKTMQEYNRILCDGIKGLLGCEVVRSNITSKVPPYPYVSFTVTSIQESGGTYADDYEKKWNLARITYSWTVQSDDDAECWEKVQRLHDWFIGDGRLYLQDNGLAFSSLGDINQRDNVITIEYEYRKGFDTVFNLLNFVERDTETIETFTPTTG